MVGSSKQDRMGIKVLTCVVEWSFYIPRVVGRTVLSTVIEVGGSKWYFTLTKKWNMSTKDETLTMVLVKFENVCEEELPSKFLLVVHARNKYMENVYMTHREITQCKTQIWECSKNSFLDLCPQICDRNKITFIFTFEYDIGNFKDYQKPEREHKSVQTSPVLNCLENLSLDLGKLVEKAPDPDVRLKCGDCTIFAHRLILGARSEVFRSMLKLNSAMTVEIVDMAPEVFQLFVRYLYTGVLPELTEDIASPLYEAGDKYRLEALRGRCGDFLAQNLTPENACAVLVKADAHSDVGLKQRAVSYIIDEEIPNDEDQWPQFCEVYPKLAFEVLNRAFKQFV